MMLASWRGRLHDESERVQQARPAAGWRRCGTGRRHGGVRRRRCVADHDTPSVEHAIVVVDDQLVVDVDDRASDDHDGTGHHRRAVGRRAEPGDRRPPRPHQGHRADAGRRRVRVHRHPRQRPVRDGPAGGDRPLRRRGRRRDVHPVGRRERDAARAARRRTQLRRPVDHRGSRHRPRRAQRRVPRHQHRDRRRRRGGDEPGRPRRHGGRSVLPPRRHVSQRRRRRARARRRHRVQLALGRPHVRPPDVDAHRARHGRGAGDRRQPGSRSVLGLSRRNRRHVRRPHIVHVPTGRGAAGGRLLPLRLSRHRRGGRDLRRVPEAQRHGAGGAERQHDGESGAGWSRRPARRSTC